MKFKEPKNLICTKCDAIATTTYDGDVNSYVCRKCKGKILRGIAIESVNKPVETQTNISDATTPVDAPKVEQPKPVATITKHSSSNTVDMSKYIPTHNGYIARKIEGKSDVAILNSAYKERLNTLIVGETGTGKTHAIRHFAYENNLPYMRVNLNESTTTEDLIGQMIPKDDGGFKWQDGVLTTFMRNGGVFVCDEINAANAGILFFLNPILDDERKIVLVQKDGEVIEAHPNFWFLSTMNPDYEGTKPLNSALKDRYPVQLDYDFDKDVEKKLIKDTKILKAVDGLRDMFKKGEIHTPVGTRTLLQYQDNKRIFGDRLAIHFFLNKFEIQERQPVKAVLDLKLGTDKNATAEKADDEVAK